jgi:hypothetical protein
MPYNRELANKASHFDIVKNPDVSKFLDDCDYLKPPSEKEATNIVSEYSEVPTFDQAELPRNIIAIDGSRHESNISDRLPSTRIGYVKVSSVLIRLDEFNALRVGRFVDPFRVAALQDNSSSLTLAIPSSNIRWGGHDSVRDSFRAKVDQFFYGRSTRFKPDDPKTSLRTTLFHLAHRRPKGMATPSPRYLKISKCPTCESGPLTLEDKPEQQYCEYCHAKVYPTDVLRLWEEIMDYQANLGAITRLMLIIEHLLPIHFIRRLSEGTLSSLSRTAFFIDGPMAVFGVSAWLHASIMRYIAEVNERLNKKNFPDLLMIGLQKTGQLVDHVNLIDRHIPGERLFAVNDQYRYKYVISSRKPSSNGFGFETYYGQDFIYKTASERTFVFALPYPFKSKLLPDVNFIQEKTDFKHYETLCRALAVINHFQTDLYENAVVPIALANKYTAISLVPGGSVLDILTRQGLGYK